MKRRDMLKITLASGGLALTAQAKAAPACPGDGTPNQFIPKTPPDLNPLENEFGKYPKCPYCGMDRKEHNATRMLVHYSDNLADGTCSIHCLALSLGLNVDREPTEIWGPDFASSADPRPLVQVDKLTYLIGADLKHAMTKRSKHSFASAATAKEFQAKHGGMLAKFDDALRESYLDMATDVVMIRKIRVENRKRIAEGKASR
ncbi:MAG: nitrous oxide reductase accessory protein NosL [Candidatus Dechloromonas phosphoritropha]